MIAIFIVTCSLSEMQYALYIPIRDALSVLANYQYRLIQQQINQ